MKKKILAYTDAVFIHNDFEKEGFASENHVDLSVVYRERYSQEVISFEELKPFLVEVIPNRDNQKPFLVLLFGKSEWQVIKFCSNHYPSKSVKIVDLLNIWLVPYPYDMDRIREYNKQFDLITEE